jgi:two-component system sensor histidine kinase PhoQ
MLSITQRLSLSAGAGLLLLLLTAGVLLDRVFALSLEQLVRDKLKLHTYVLLALAEYNDGRIDMPSVLSEQRFNTPGSGLIAFISAGDESATWRSRSAQDNKGGSYYVSVYGTSWQQGGVAHAITFSVVEDRHSYDIWVADFRRAIAIALLLFGAMLFLLQAGILRWSLKPLKKAARDVDAMNEGQTTALTDHYPAELEALTDSINRLLENERRQRERYRDTLADLSHSLKTPLTVLQGLADDRDEQGLPLSRDEVCDAVMRHGGRMREIIDYQLQRASATQQNISSARTPILPMIETVVAALDKVYAEKAIVCSLAVDSALQFRCDENDIIELLGNVIDNAYKHCNGRVSVAAELSGQVLQLRIDDDGPGVPPHRRDDILQRGVRLDTRAEGQGFGLAITADIVASYNGRISITESQWGGARFDICLR